jgi:hypothetical protein
MDIEENILPEEVSKLLRQESYDFVVKADKAFPPSKSFIFLAIGILSLLFNFATSSAASPVINMMSAPEMFNGFNLFTLSVALFVSVSLGFLGYGFYLFFAEGAWFVGTPKGLVICKKNEMKTVSWGDFSGTIGVSGTAEKGSITLLMKTGQVVSRNYYGFGRNSYVPDIIYMIGIKNAFQISESMRKRIKEGDQIKLNIV